MAFPVAPSVSMVFLAAALIAGTQGQAQARVSSAPAGVTGAAQAPATARATAPATATATATATASGGLAEIAGQLARSPDTIVATVNGTPITAGMVADRMMDFPTRWSALPVATVYQAALEDLVQQRAMAIKAKALGLDKLAETRRRIAEATDRELAQALYRRIVPELVTEKAIDSAYKAMIAGKPGPEEVRFRVIATDTESQAEALLARLRDGADFASLARQDSKDPSALNGGEIGFATRSSLTPAIGAVAFSLAPGQTTAMPVFAQNHWFIIRVEERRQLGTPSLSQSRGRIIAALRKAAALEILRKSQAAVVVKNFGAAGMTGSKVPTAPATH